MRKIFILRVAFLILFSVIFNSTQAYSSTSMMHWTYKLKPYYSRIIPINSSYFMIEKILAGGKSVKYIFNEKTNKYIPLNEKYMDLKCLNENGAGFYAQYDKEADKKLYGFLNFEKKIFVQPRYSNYIPFEKGTAVVQDYKTEKYFIIDENGMNHKGPFNEYITGVDEENFRLKRVRVVDNSYHSHYEYIYTDKNGENVFNSKKFLSAHPFYDGYAMVASDGGACGYIDKTSKLVVPYWYTNCSNFINGSALLYAPKSHKTFVVNKKLEAYEVKESYGEMTEDFLQNHDPNGLILYSKYTDKYAGDMKIKLPKHYKTIYARRNNGEVVIPPGLYYEGEHVYKDYYLFKKYDIRKDEYGHYLIQSDKSVLISKSGQVYDNYKRLEHLKIPLNYIAELKKRKIMAIDKDLSEGHIFSWANFKNKKGTREDNNILIMEDGKYGILKFTQ